MSECGGCKLGGSQEEEGRRIVNMTLFVCHEQQAANVEVKLVNFL